MDILQIIIILILFGLLIIPFGKYIYKVISHDKSFVDPVFDRLDGIIYKVIGSGREDMNWKQYIFALLLTNFVMTVFVYIVFRLQGTNFLNPNKASAMEPSLAFNTAVSFMTNTNLQNYSGEWGASYLSQVIAITFLMFTSAGTGFAAASAFIRGITGRKSPGNFFVDLTRITTRVMIPLSLVLSLSF
jgi:K+-transporting ATPase ATPase A chain